MYLLEQITLQKFYNLEKPESKSDYTPLKRKLSSLGFYDEMYIKKVLDGILLQDPTYQECGELDSSCKIGAYSLWLKKQILNSSDSKAILKDFSLEDNGPIILRFKSILTSYHNIIRKKKYQEQKERNIDFFNTVEELERFIGNIVGEDDSGLKLAQNKEFVHYVESIKSGELVTLFQNDQFVIYVPLTKQQAISVQQFDTEWCVRYKNENNKFDSMYNSQPLFFIVDKVSTNQNGYQLKYQLYYNIFEPSTMQEINMGNASIDVYDFLLEHKDLLPQFQNMRNLLKEKIKKPLNNEYKLNIDRFDSTIICILQKIILGIKIEDSDFQNIIELLRNKNTIVNGYIKYFPKNIIREQMLKNPHHLKDLPLDLITIELQKDLVNKNGINLMHLVDQGIVPDEEIQELQVQNDGRQLEYIYNNPSDHVKELQVQQFGNQIALIDKPSRTIQKLQVSNYGSQISFLFENNIEPDTEIQILQVQNDITQNQRQLYSILHYYDRVNRKVKQQVIDEQLENPVNQKQQSELISEMKVKMESNYYFNKILRID